MAVGCWTRPQKCSMFNINTQLFKHAESGCCPLFVPSSVFFLPSHLYAGSVLTSRYTAGMFFSFSLSLFFLLTSPSAATVGHCPLPPCRGTWPPSPLRAHSPPYWWQQWHNVWRGRDVDADMPLVAACTADTACSMVTMTTTPRSPTIAPVTPHTARRQWLWHQMRCDDTAPDTKYSATTPLLTPNTARWYCPWHHMWHDDHNRNSKTWRCMVRTYRDCMYL